jgi:Ca-activated chloride channel family protein
VGYENRRLAAKDFKDDTKDAGEIGAGHTVTALYEVVPAGSEVAAVDPEVDPLKYQRPPEPPKPLPTGSAELLTVKLRWKEPQGTTSVPMEVPLTDSGASYAQASADFKFAASVAAFALLLRDSPQRGTATFDSVAELAGEGLSFDPGAWRKEFLDLVAKAKSLSATR